MSSNFNRLELTNFFSNLSKLKYYSNSKVLKIYSQELKIYSLFVVLSLNQYLPRDYLLNVLLIFAN